MYALSFTDATAPGVCDGGDGLRRDIRASFLYDCPWYESCACEDDMIQAKGATTTTIPLFKNDFGTDTNA